MAIPARPAERCRHVRRHVVRYKLPFLKSRHSQRVLRVLRVLYVSPQAHHKRVGQLSPLPLSSRCITSGLTSITAHLIAPSIFPECSANSSITCRDFPTFPSLSLLRLSHYRQPSVHTVSCLASSPYLQPYVAPVNHQRYVQPSFVYLVQFLQPLLPNPFYPYHHGSLGRPWPSLAALGTSESYLNRVHLWAVPSGLPILPPSSNAMFALYRSPQRTTPSASVT